MGELISAEDLPHLSCDELSALLEELKSRLQTLDSELESHACSTEQQGFARDVCLALADLETFLSRFAQRVLRSRELCELRPDGNRGRKTLQRRAHRRHIHGVA
jgi:hypothetical protein